MVTLVTSVTSYDQVTFDASFTKAEAQESGKIDRDGFVVTPRLVHPDHSDRLGDFSLGDFSRQALVPNPALLCLTMPMSPTLRISSGAFRTEEIATDNGRDNVPTRNIYWLEDSLQCLISITPTASTSGKQTNIRHRTQSIINQLTQAAKYLVQ